MAFEQHIEDCTEHEGCTVIIGEQDGRTVWWSHAVKEINPGHRLNLDHPVANDRRKGAKGPVKWSLWCDDCLSHFPHHDPATLKSQVAAEAKKKGL